MRNRSMLLVGGLARLLLSSLSQIRRRRESRPGQAQGHSKKALNSKVDGAEPVLGEGVAGRSSWRLERSEKPEGSISQGCEGLGRIVGPHPAGIFGEGGVSDPVEAILDAPVLAIEVEEILAGSALAGQAGDGVDGFLRLLAGQLPGAMDAADLGHAGPVEIGRDLAGRGQLTLLDPAVALVDRSRRGEIRRRAVPGCPGRPLAVQRGDQLRGEKRRRRRRRHRPSAGVGWL